ncbi:MAG TPA: DMT family transporter [Acidimicrobiales bacterium]|jgi:drug/metabolite transporter (DMT)-like permease|nr:DMT family transporter [Acidimicrobiales bacterium]
MVIAIIAAVASAAAFAVASVVQQMAARRAPRDDTMSLRLLVDLVRQPMWLGGVVASVVAFGLQALALGFGPLVLVQPLIVLEMVFALPLAARLRHRRLGPRDWGATVSVAGGLSLFLLSAGPGSQSGNPSDLTWLVIVSAVAGIVLACQGSARLTHGAVRATLLGICAGTAFGLLSALLKTVTYLLAHHGVLGTLASWQPYALAVVAIAGEVFAQSAFQSGPLAASLPVMDALEPAVAVAIAVAAFGETMSHSALALGAEGAGIVMVIAGIVVLDRSPLILSLQRREQACEQPEGDQEGSADDGAATAGEDVAAPTGVGSAERRP